MVILTKFLMRSTKETYLCLKKIFFPLNPVDSVIFFRSSSTSSWPVTAAPSPSKKGGQIPLADNPDELLYLATGKVKAYMFDDEGHERLLYIFIKDTLIFHSVSEQYCKNLVTLEKATLYSIPLTDVFAFLQSDAAFIRKYSALIAARYGILLQQVLTTNRLGAKSKVYSFLISLVHKYGTLQEDGSYLVSKFPTLTDLASLTDVHRSNVTSYINSLETQGIIHRQKKQLIVNDLEALEALAEEG